MSCTYGYRVFIIQYHAERLDLRFTIPLTFIEIFKICFFPNLVSPLKSSASHRRNPEGDIPLSTGNQDKTLHVTAIFMTW